MADLSGSADITLRLLDISATTAENGNDGELNIDFPNLQVESETLYGMAGVGEIELLFTVAGDGVTGQRGSANVTLPLFEASGDDFAGGLGDVTFPKLIAAGLGLDGDVGEYDEKLPGLIVSAYGVAEGDCIAEITFPRFQVAGTGIQEERGVGNCALSLVTIQGTGISGEVGHADIALPALAALSAGAENAQGVADITFPAFIVEASGSTNIGATLAADIVDVVTYSMNLNNLGVSTYVNYPFNSYCEFKGSYLGAKANGIYLLVRCPGHNNSNQCAYAERGYWASYISQEIYPGYFRRHGS